MFFKPIPPDSARYGTGTKEKNPRALLSLPLFFPSFLNFFIMGTANICLNDGPIVQNIFA